MASSSGEVEEFLTFLVTGERTRAERMDFGELLIEGRGSFILVGQPAGDSLKWIPPPSWRW